MVSSPQLKTVQGARASYFFMALLLLLIVLVIQFAALALAPQETPRKIVSDDFTKNRQESAPVTTRGQAPQSGNGNSGSLRSRPAHRTYRLASQSATRTRPTANTVIAQLGITIWRLRPADATDGGGRALIREKGKGWTAERVEGDAVFREGDHLRISVESPRAGYLYVVDRDLFSDGTIGGAMLIYPWSEADNHTRPGRLIDIPAQEDDPSYFTARLTSANQAGELLTFIVTSAPLDLPIGDKPFQIATGQMRNWEKLWSGQFDRFEMDGGAGEAWTQVEKQAAAKTGARQLTRDDPAPQTIFQVLSSGDKPILVNLRLSYTK